MKTYNSTNTPIPVFYTTLTEPALIELIEDVVRRVMSETSTNVTTSRDPEELLTRVEAAKEFKVSVPTIDNYKRDGLLIPCRIRGTVRYKRSDLQKAFSSSIINPYKVQTPKANGRNPVN